MACDSPNRYASISLELRAASVALSLKFRRQIGVRPEFSDRTARKPRDIPDDMTLDSFEMVEDGIARVQIKHQVPAAVWLLWGIADGRDGPRGLKSVLFRPYSSGSPALRNPSKVISGSSRGLASILYSSWGSTCAPMPEPPRL